MRLEPGTTKNGEGRTFFVTDELRAILDQWKALGVVGGSRIVPWVVHRHGEQIKSVSQGVADRAQGGRCAWAHLHDFRRTAVRNLVRAGVPERVAMQMTGHKTRSVFERYNVVSEANLRAASEHLAAVTPKTASPVRA